MYSKAETDTKYKLKNRGMFMKVDVPETVWTSTPAMSGKTSVGGINVNTGTGTDGYLSLSSSTGKLHLFVDGDVYTNEGRDKVYTTGNKPTAADVGLGNVPNTTRTTAATANTVAVRDSA
ncbi:hypothetical protein [Cetobacterium sp.]|uniref:hypothetical protein n=1 Tax=Cetobacterium sp. TaxID=2071632 RepID=UPI003F397ACE